VTLVLLVGGARSGKSRLALERAVAPVVFIATGEARDDEMAERIERHRRERSEEWETVEEPVELERALGEVPAGATAIVDCLSLWVANTFETLPVEELAAGAARTAAAREGLTIAVTNEVGLGIVPDNALARAYRDALGRVNAIWAEAADEAYLVVAGRTLRLV
jgi:adenosyl cobinamide kinase/adenosyl cobinamide phosphate guanylyltransferase